MSLQDFMQQLQEQDNEVVYSKPPEEAIQVIPPTKSEPVIQSENIKVIPPKEEKPKVIKFKLSHNYQQQEKPEAIIQNNSEKVAPKVIIPPKKPNSPQQDTVVKTESIQETKPTQVNTEPQNTKNISKEEELFIRSETPLSKKEIWFEYYNKALKSKKDNFITERCRSGRFMINEENKFIALSDYDTYDKSVNEILKDNWF